MTSFTYTCKGLQRCTSRIRANVVSFSLENAPDGSSVEFTSVPVPALLNSTAAERAIFNGSFIPLNVTTGVVAGATALRVRIGECSGCCAVLSLNEHQDDPELGCIGELTRINSTLARMNDDLRFCAAVA